MVSKPGRPLTDSSLAGPVPGQAVRDQLTRVVTSEQFASSPRLCRFLSHIVDRTLAGDADSLKEFTIAMEVFDRSATYDSNIDAIVRVEARRLRAKLKAYYDTAKDAVLIGLPTGSYVPNFRWLEPPASERGQESEPPLRRSIAVLPFVNMSPEPEQDYFCDGISEEIINSLTYVSGLNVIARTSAFQFKGVAIDIREVGKRLSADLIVEGSVRKAGDELRITAQAIETSSGHHLWSKTFRREMRDIFAIQEEIAQAIAGLLRVDTPAFAIGTPNIEAYGRYLRTRFLIHQQTFESLQAAAAQLREFVAAYPDYALGYSGLAAALGSQTIFGFVSGRDVFDEIKRNAERGYKLDPDSAETCSVLAGFRASFERRWKEADTLFERAVQLQPGHAVSYVYWAMASVCQGDIDGGEMLLRRSMELDPLSAGDCARMAYVHYLKGEDGLAKTGLHDAFQLDRDYPEARFYQGLLYFRQDHYKTVLEILSHSLAPLDLGLLAAANGRLGRQSDAAACVNALRESATEHYVTPLAFGLAAIGMGQLDVAFQNLEAAVEDNTNFVNMLRVEPFFEPLRKDPRLPGLLRKLNLTD